MPVYRRQGTLLVKSSWLMAEKLCCDFCCKSEDIKLRDKHLQSCTENHKYKGFKWKAFSRYQRFLLYDNWGYASFLLFIFSHSPGYHARWWNGKETVSSVAHQQTEVKLWLLLRQNDGLHGCEAATRVVSDGMKTNILTGSTEETSCPYCMRVGAC